MDTMLIFDVVIAAFGIYLAYVALRMKRTGEIHAFLVSEEERGKCKDPRGFIERIYIKVAVFGGISFFCGVFDFVGSLARLLSRQAEVAAYLIFLASCIWFAYDMKKGKDGFF